MARGLADYLEVPHALADAAGAPAAAAMMAIKHGVDAGGGDLRQVPLANAQAHMAELDPRRHGLCCSICRGSFYRWMDGLIRSSRM